MRLPLTTVLGAWCFAGVVRSYQIHSSCGDDTKFVREMVESAFDMAGMTLAAVKGVPIVPKANWLGGQLFQRQNADLKNLIVSRFDAQQQPNWQGVTPGILSFQKEQTGNLDALSISEVVIFCTTDRFSQMPNEPKDSPKMFDSVAKKAVKGSNGNCAGFESFMWTYTFSDQWDMIQICPWFLEYAKTKKYKTYLDVPKSTRAKLSVMGLDKLVTKFKLTPIDLVSLWDKTMLHEFMHTKAGGECEDVVDVIDADTTTSAWDTAYGWKNAKALAAPSDDRAHNNADNYALFGSAYRQMVDGHYIDQDGNFLAKAVVIVKRWLGSRLGVAQGARQAAAFQQLTS